MEVTESLEDVMKGVGSIVRELREGAEITQRRMAKELGVSQARISEIENGLGDAKVSTLLRYAQYFDHELWIFITPPEEESNGETAELPSH